MKLPKIIKFLGFGIIVFFFVVVVFSPPKPAFAQLDATDSAETTGWVRDPEVTFIGKTASRSAQFLDWTIQNYNWLCMVQKAENVCDNTGNPLIPFWATIRNIVYGIIALFVLATAFVLIITRGQNVTIMRFVPRFIFVVVLIYFSFTLVQFIYTLTDIVQGFFLTSPNPNEGFISTKNLLYMGFNYQDFIGYRYVDPTGKYDESAFISMLLVRLTAITYYVMTGILIVRKIILWFFIIISPVFPLLIFYKPLRNTAKIWVGEFFRWLLYAPLFAIFLKGLVVVWIAGIPLPFKDIPPEGGERVVYPTAINILLGGPGQEIFYKGPLNSNSVNLPDTFALYVVALIMLWVVILLPFLLLKIFLDYLGTLSFDSNILMQRIKSPKLPFIAPSGSGPTPPPPPPGQTQPAGMAKSLPFFSGHAAAIPVHYQASAQGSIKESSQILQSANLSIPRMRDIAAYETSLMSQRAPQRAAATNLNSTLSKIANPASATSISEREKFSTVRQKLLEQKQKGNPIAASVLSASQVSTATSTTTTSTTNVVQSSVATRKEQVEHVSQVLKTVSNPELAQGITEKEKAAKLKQQLTEKRDKGDKLAASILEAQDEISKSTTVEKKEEIQNKLIDKLLEAEKNGDPLAKEMLPQKAPAKPESLPMVNHVQQVSLEDYEEVRKLWTENYQNIEPPKALNGEQVNREEWIKNDIDKINQAITLLSGVDPSRVNQGMSMVSTILPFLLIGGFSKSEVIAYLKAKMEAGKQVLDELKKKEENEDTMVERKETEEKKEQTQEASVPVVEGTENEQNQPKELEDAPQFGEADKNPQNGGQNSGNNGGNL